MPKGVYKHKKFTALRKIKHSQMARNSGFGLWMIGRLEGKSNHWKGGKQANAGYVQILNRQHPFADKRGRIMEHRLVVEKIIGRYLTPKEEVHHLGKKSDNSPAMLIAFSTQGAHLRFEKGCCVKPDEIIFDGRTYGNIKNN